MSLQVIQSGRPRIAILSGKSMGLNLNVKTITANYIVQLTDDIILVNCTAGNIDVHIADASDKKEKVYTIKKIDSSANYVYILAADTVPIDAPVSEEYFLRRQFESITLISAQSQWLSISKSDRTTIERARDASENINIYEKTSNELVLRLNRASAGKYSATFTGHIQKTVTSNITAFATGGQANAVVLVSDINEIRTCATAGDSVKLPVGVIGMEIMVVNRGAAAMNLFPPVDGYLNAGAVNVAVSIAINATAIAYCIAILYWEVVEVTRA